jgi:two-component system, LytTR family, sensor kinase
MASDPAVRPVDTALLPGSAMASRAKAGGGSRLGWWLYALCGLLFGLYMGLNAVIGTSGVDAWKPMLWELSSVAVIFPILPLIVLYERRFPIDSTPRWRLILPHLCGALAFSAVHVTGIVILRKLFYAFAGETYTFGNVAVRGFYEFQKDLLVYAIVLMLIFAYRQFQTRRQGELRAIELNAELSDARLKHLTAQIEPHFLFNTLNAISNRMHEDVEAADRMISELGGLLRAAYDGNSQVLVPLAQEIGWLRGYAAMMTERYRGQLHFELKVAPGLELCPVPRLLLQPLVENALRHGMPDGRGHLSVEVDRQDALLRYRISDDGVGVESARVPQGTGLSNISRRLELLYPGTHTFTLAPRAPRGTQATLTFPVAM